MIKKEKIKLAEKCLIDNGISEEEAATVLQAIGYTLLDEELYPEGCEDPDLKIWSVPVLWTACGNYLVKARSFEQAAKYIEKTACGNYLVKARSFEQAAKYIENAKNIPLPGNQVLIDFFIDYDGVTLFNGANGSTEPIDDTVYVAKTSK